MFAVVDGFVEQHRHVVVVQAVDDALTGAATDDQTEVTQHTQLVGHGRLFHSDRLRQFRYGAWALPQPGQDQQPAGRRERLQGRGHISGRIGIENRWRLTPVVYSMTHTSW